jgi:hypothetical protein
LNTVKRTYNTVKNTAKQGLNTVKNTAKQGLNTVKSGFNTVKNTLKSGYNTVKSGFNTVKDSLKNVNWRDAGHTALDIAGFIPVVGAVADVANAAWYLAEGDYANAALSGVSAIPGVGDAIGLAGKGGKATLKLAKGNKLLGKAGKFLPNAGKVADKVGGLVNKVPPGLKSIPGKVTERLKSVPIPKKLKSALGKAMKAADYVGVGSNLAAAGQYAAQGDYVNATLSVVSALPGAHQIGKRLPRAAKNNKLGNKLGKLFPNAGKLFGQAGSLVNKVPRGLKDMLSKGKGGLTSLLGKGKGGFNGAKNRVNRGFNTAENKVKHDVKTPSSNRLNEGTTAIKPPAVEEATPAKRPGVEKTTATKPPVAEETAPTKPPVTEKTTPNGRSTHADKPEVEPSVVAKEQAADGHQIKVLKDGRVVRCSICGELRNQYANELEQRSDLKQRLDDIEKISDPDLKAKQAQELEQTLAKIAKSNDRTRNSPDAEAKAPGTQKNWDDPGLTKEEYIEAYKKRHPNTTLSEEDIGRHFDEGKRLNPETGRPITSLPTTLDGWRQWAEQNPGMVGEYNVRGILDEYGDNPEYAETVNRFLTNWFSGNYTLNRKTNRRHARQLHRLGMPDQVLDNIEKNPFINQEVSYLSRPSAPTHATDTRKNTLPKSSAPPVKVPPNVSMEVADIIKNSRTTVKVGETEFKEVQITVDGTETMYAIARDTDGNIKLVKTGVYKRVGNRKQFERLSLDELQGMQPVKDKTPNQPVEGKNYKDKELVQLPGKVNDQGEVIDQVTTHISSRVTPPVSTSRGQHGLVGANLYRGKKKVKYLVVENDGGERDLLPAGDVVDENGNIFAQYEGKVVGSDIDLLAMLPRRPNSELAGLAETADIKDIAEKKKYEEVYNNTIEAFSTDRVNNPPPQRRDTLSKTKPTFDITAASDIQHGANIPYEFEKFLDRYSLRGANEEETQNNIREFADKHPEEFKKAVENDILVVNDKNTVVTIGDKVYSVPVRKVPLIYKLLGQEFPIKKYLPLEERKVR